MYQNGQGVQKDEKEAVALFSQAAEQGDAKAQSNLGKMISLGDGVERDPVKAYKWLKLSADQGEATAQNLLSDFQHGLTTEQISEGNRLIEEYRAALRSTPSH